MEISTSPIIQLDEDEDETTHLTSTNLIATATTLNQFKTLEFNENSKLTTSHSQFTNEPSPSTIENKSNNSDQPPNTLSNQQDQSIDNSSAQLKSSITIPNITIHAGPPPKRNVALKNTSAHLNLLNRPNPSLNNQPAKAVKQNIRVNEDEIMSLDDKEADSNDEYIPPKYLRDESDMSDSDNDSASSTKRKSTRLIKKPKILDEFVIDDSDNISNSPTSQQQQLSTSRITIEPNTNTNTKQEPESQPTASLPSIKSTARKSTAPLTTSNLNHINIQRQQTRPIITNSSPIIPQQQSAQSSLITAINGATNPTKQAPKPTLNGTNTKTPTVIAQNSNLITSRIQPALTQTSQVIQTQTSTIGAQKQYRNKMVSCKPIYQSKSTECHPTVKDASTQIDLDEIKLSHTIVPIPVPINVPVPMCMYQAPMPIPLLIPVPIPVPVFIPTTKKTFDRVQRRIRKLRKKLPSDPYEFEILLYAEKLAREEGLPGFEDSSDGESDSEQNGNCLSKKRSFISMNTDSMHENENHNQNQFQHNDQLQMIQSECEGSFKWNIGVKVFNTWLANKIDHVKFESNCLTRFPNDLLKLKNEELNALLAEFLNEVRKPNGEIYAPESIYYICLGIQHYMQEKGRVENIFLDSSLFDQFEESLNEIAGRYKIRLDSDGLVASRIEEEILWESKQLGAFSPFVLLNTILYFNTKYFFLDKVDAHKKLSFTNVKKHSKRNIGPNGEDYGKTVFLRYYPDFHGLEQVIYEQGENYDNPLRCPVELYNFYLSKCPESVKNRNDVFYLLPEKASLPSSPVWFSSQPLGDRMLERMLNRIKMVKEVNELLLAAAPATTSLIVQ